MSFTQLLRFRVTDPDEVTAIRDRWMKATDGLRTATHMELYRLHDAPDTYVQLVSFPSAEAAQQNSELEATGQWADEMRAAADGEVEFTDLELVERVDL